MHQHLSSPILSHPSSIGTGLSPQPYQALQAGDLSIFFPAGVLTETTAELALSLTFAAARRIVEADKFMRGGKYEGWLPNLFVGNLLQRKTVGIVGAGRIGTAYARMMMEGHKCNLVYYDPYPNKFLEKYVAEYAKVGHDRLSWHHVQCKAC